MTNILRQFLCGVTLQFAASAALANCPAPKLLAPVERTTSEARPAIRWSATKGATDYALKIQSRIPEGRLGASFDVVVADTLFVPPTALVDTRAKVTVTLAARCADGISAAVTRWFLIDTAANCPLPTALRITRDQGRGFAAWGAVTGAASYEVRSHSAMDGRVLTSLVTREPHASLAEDIPDGAVLSVRARCAGGFGEPALGLVANYREFQNPVTRGLMVLPSLTPGPSPGGRGVKSEGTKPGNG